MNLLSRKKNCNENCQKAYRIWKFDIFVIELIQNSYSVKVKYIERVNIFIEFWWCVYIVQVEHFRILIFETKATKFYFLEKNGNLKAIYIWQVISRDHISNFCIVIMSSKLKSQRRECLVIMKNKSLT